METIIEVLNKNKNNINIDYWITQWEYMQNAYIPYRMERFTFVINLTKYLFRNQGNVKILDIGCGPLSFSGKFLDHWNTIRITGIDYHPLLYWLGFQKYRNYKNIDIELIDIRYSENFDKIKDKNFDLVISSTALHWLSANNLTKVIKKSFVLLKENGFFINVDHIKNENNDIQTFVENERKKHAEQEFQNKHIKNWNAYFDDFYKENNLTEWKNKINKIIGECEGVEQGLTFNEFTVIMGKAGFKEIDCVWQYLNDRIIIGRK